MRSFAVCLLDKLRRSAPFYEAFDVGVLRLADSSCRMAFGPKLDTATSRTRRYYSALTVSVCS